MPSLSDTIARLSRIRGMAQSGSHPVDEGRLTDLASFGSNPGDLRAKMYVPGHLADRPALVVVLHGCTQTAGSYDLGSGWSELADRHGFVLLFPEQQRHNNPNLCFNWFLPEDNRRGAGEALSVRQMIDAMISRHAIDPARVFVTGLSAGGAMTSVMLATYPEVFAGGAIIAGLPYGCASTIPQAFDRMRGHGGGSESELAAAVRRASDHRGPWPTISVWHGSGDATVNPSNADAIISQWRGVHGVAAVPTRTEAIDGYPRRVWCDDQGREVIEEYSITGMGHGTPLDTFGDDGCGRSGAYMLEASISSTRHICQFWGLTGAVNRTERSRASQRPAPPRFVVASEPMNPGRTGECAEAQIGTAGVGKVIEDALRAAGLMR